MAKLIDYRMPNNGVYDIRPDGALSIPIASVVNHTGITIDFIRHSDGTIELRSIDKDN